jgi:hypothetical protein
VEVGGKFAEKALRVEEKRDESEMERMWRGGPPGWSCWGDGLASQKRQKQREKREREEERERERERERGRERERKKKKKKKKKKNEKKKERTCRVGLLPVAGSVSHSLSVMSAMSRLSCRDGMQAFNKDCNISSTPLCQSKERDPGGAVQYESTAFLQYITFESIIFNIISAAAMLTWRPETSRSWSCIRKHACSIDFFTCFIVDITSIPAYPSTDAHSKRAIQMDRERNVLW